MSYDDMTLDAIMYCLRVAEEEDKPIVINTSFGSESKPGDGLDPYAVFVDETFDPNGTGSPSNPAMGDFREVFQTGAVLVASAGNSGDKAAREKARIVIPGTGEVILPLEFYDNRGGVLIKEQSCKTFFHAPKIKLTLWYQAVTAPASVDFAMKCPGVNSFISVNPEENLAFWAKPGHTPPYERKMLPNNANAMWVRGKHNSEAPVPHPNGGTVHRRSFQLSAEPKTVANKSIEYVKGIYHLRIQGPAGTELYLDCGYSGWKGKGKYAGFRIPNPVPNQITIPADVHIDDSYSMGDTLGRHAITVGNYDGRPFIPRRGAQAGTNNTKRHHITASSGRGPIRDYSSSIAQGPLGPKPDIAAPGNGIKSASSVLRNPPAVPSKAWKEGDRYTTMSGTSMAAPFVTGAVAIALQQNRNLNVTAVRALVKNIARAGVSPAQSPEREYAYGAGMLDVKAMRDAMP